VAGDIGRVLFDRYAASVHGQWHAEQPLRYVAKFGSYGRDQMLADFGSDVHPLQHMLATERALRALIAMEGPAADWSLQDIDAGFTASMTHDDGECTHPELVIVCGGVVGDIPQGQKSDTDRMAEAGLQRYLFAEHCGDCPDAYLVRIKNIIAHKEDSLINHGLEGAHNTDTFRIGLRSFRLWRDAVQISPESPRTAQLHTMAKVVTADAIIRLQKDAAVFKYPDFVLNKAAPLLRRMEVEL
jgi:hypothetical protein